MVSPCIRRKAVLFATILALVLVGKDGNAQPYVNIPDPVFRAYIDSIVPGAIVGNDLNTSHPGLQSVSMIDVMWKGLTDITGVQYFPNLQFLYCAWNQLTFLPPLPSGLVELYCNDNLLTAIPPLPQSLYELICVANQLASLPALPAGLDHLHCSNNPLSSIPTLPAGLSLLECDNCNLSVLPPLGGNLQAVACSNNFLSALPPLPSTLATLSCTNNFLTSLPALPNGMWNLYVSGNPDIWCLPNLPTNPSFSCDIGNLVCTPQGTPGTWFKMAGMTVDREMAVSVGIGSNCYLGLGYHTSIPNDWWELNASTNTWTQKANVPGTGRWCAVAFSIGDKGYVGLGQGSGPSYLNDFWEYSPATNTWNQVANYPGTGYFGNAAFSIGNKGYVGLGQAPGYLFPHEFYAFDPAANAWTPSAGFPGLGRSQSACFSAGNKGYVIGGDYSNGLTATSYAYDPVTDTWSAIASYPQAINEAAAFGINGKGYVTCGQYFMWNGPVNRWLYEYDPALNNWIPCPDLPALPRTRTTGCTAGGRGYAGTGLTQKPSGSWVRAGDWWEYTPLCTTPSATIYASGNTTICQGDSVMLYADNGNTYQWKKNGANVAGAVKSFMYAKSSGTYSCLITNSCSSVTSVNIGITVKPLPDASITASGSTTICKPESVTLNAVVKANRSYQWKRNGVIIPGATASSLVVTQSGYYKVIVTNTNTGCSNTTGNATHVIAYSKPSAKITPSGIVTFCAGQSALLTANSGNNYSYQWKKDGTLIPGATNQTLTVTTAGLYKVIVTRQNGCSKVSKADTVVVPCRTTQQEEINKPFPGYRVYPNPAGAFVTVDAGRPGPAEFILFDAMQRVVLRQPFDATKQVSLGELTPGLYRYLVLRNGVQEASGKLIRE